MTDRPIIFSAPMVRALLTGRKTQTRRILKLPHNNPLGVWEATIIGGRGVYYRDGSPAPERPGIWHTRTGDCLVAPFDPGDRLWVRESWDSVPDSLSECTGPDDIYYAASVSEAKWATTKWRSPIFMPRYASRLTLTITDVRVQRLHDIIDADAIAEGVCCFVEQFDRTAWGLLSQQNREALVRAHYGTATKAYSHLWETIHGTDSWALNPWVSALTFTVSRRDDPALNADLEEIDAGEEVA